MWGIDIKYKYMFMFSLKNLARKGPHIGLMHLSYQGNFYVYFRSEASTARGVSQISLVCRSFSQLACCRVGRWNKMHQPWPRWLFHHYSGGGKLIWYFSVGTDEGSGIGDCMVPHSWRFPVQYIIGYQLIWIQTQSYKGKVIQHPSNVISDI